MIDPFRHIDKSHHSTFGNDTFGTLAERLARSFGTARYIICQSVVVVIWIALNIVAINYKWDPYPFILLNLAFSTQAAYAAPLILLAQTRQTDRDKAHAEAAAKHAQEESDQLKALITYNNQLTDKVAELTEEIHKAINK